MQGLELDEPKLGAFAGFLNALDFPVQLLVRQHPPDLARMRDQLRETQPESLPAADARSGRLPAGPSREIWSRREGILDRRFYAVTELERAEELQSLLARAGLSVHPLKGRALRRLLLAAALGGTPAERDEERNPSQVEVNRRDLRLGGHLARSLHLGRWPRSLAPGFLQGLMTAGVPMDLALHLGSIPAEQAARTLEWQKVRFESAQSLSINKGRTLSSEAEIALEDVTRLRDEVQRGSGAALPRLPLSDAPRPRPSPRSVTSPNARRRTSRPRWGNWMCSPSASAKGLLSTLPLALNAVAAWRTLDTSSIARLYPFSPPDLDTRSGTLAGIDLRACAPRRLRPLRRHPPQRQHRGPRPVRKWKSRSRRSWASSGA